MLEDMKMQKRRLRAKVLRARDELPAEEHIARSAAVCNRLKSRIEQLLTSEIKLHTAKMDKPPLILSFIPFGSEVNIWPFIEWCIGRGIDIAVPRTIPASRRMVFHLIRGLQDTSPVDPYGIREPHEDLPAADPERITKIIMPGAAFDEMGNRLGYGGGYYDRYLASLAAVRKELPPLVAVCFELQIIGRIPVQDHDRQMDSIITEDREIDVYI